MSKVTQSLEGCAPDKLREHERPLIVCGMCKRRFRRIHKFDDHMWSKHERMLDKDFVD